MVRLLSASKQGDTVVPHPTVTTSGISVQFSVENVLGKTARELSPICVQIVVGCEWRDLSLSGPWYAI